MMQKRFWIDVVLGTAFIFFLMYFVLEIFDKLDILDPIGEAISDVEITDMVFSRLRDHPGASSDIVLINIGNLDREGIAEQINIVNAHHPKLIAIDVFFRNKGNARKDSLLAAAFSKVNHLVLASKLSGYNANGSFDGLETSHPIFNQYAETAFANFITGAQEQDQFKTCRTFTPKESTSSGEEVAFAVKISQIFDPGKAQAFLSRERPYEVINYRGNVLYDEGEFAHMFPALDVADIFNGNFTPDLIKDKIVIMGYMGNDFDDKSWKDKFYTPMNLDYAGKANPDMFGVVVHANIVSMILEGAFINEMSQWGSIISGILLCFINVVFFTVIYIRLPRWYDGLTKIIQIVEVIILMGVIIMVFYLFNYKLNITIGIAAILLSGDSLEAYYGVIKNLFSKNDRKEIFRIHQMNEPRNEEYA